MIFHRFSYSFFFAALLPLLTACAHLPKGDKAVITNQQSGTTPATAATFTVDTAATFIRFTGHGVGQNHAGRFHLIGGNLMVTNKVVYGGRFVINIASMQIEQPEEIYQTKLKRHLLSRYFFDTAHWQTAAFEITDVKPYVTRNNDSVGVTDANYMVSGNVTLKGVTKNVTFPAKIVMVDNGLTALANFTIDRTQWGIYYGSNKALGDKFISSLVNIQLNLKAVPQ